MSTPQESPTSALALEAAKGLYLTLRGPRNLRAIVSRGLARWLRTHVPEATRDIVMHEARRLLLAHLCPRPGSATN